MHPAIVDKIIFHRTIYGEYNREPPALAISKEESEELTRFFISLFMQVKDDDYVKQFHGVDLYIYDL